MVDHTMVSALAADTGHPQGHWETSVWPFWIALGILIMVPLPFIWHFVYGKPLLAILCLGLGVPMTVMGVAGWVREGMAGHGEGLIVPAMSWFILAEALIFLAFFAAYWFMRLTAAAWPPAGSVEMPTVIPVVMTVALIASSVTFHVAEAAHEAGSHGRFLFWLVLTMLLGAAFVTLSGFEWRELIHHGFGPGTNSYATAFFSITGFHGAHVIAGLGIFVAVLLPALAGRTNQPFVRAAGIYWHFVDVVWLFVVTQIYFW